MNKYSLIFLLIVGAFMPKIGFNQTTHEIFLNWGKEKVLSQGDRTIIVPNIIGQNLDGNVPNFFWKTKLLNNSKYSLDLELVSFSPASIKEINYLASQFIEVDELKYDLAVSRANEERFAKLNLFPFFKKEGITQKVDALKITIGAGEIEQNIFTKDFFTNSVLQDGSGYWYKISVKEDGIHKIDKAFLEACGIDVASLDPQDIHIFGNGDGRLPELNSIARTDDLAENAIQIIGEGDGAFDDSDYILFYGFGPNRLYSTSALTYNQDRNPYSNESVYFININSALAPKRIADMPSSDVIATNVVTSYSYHDVHEVDSKSLVKAGQRWYGELFDTQLQRSFSFDVPNIETTSDARFEVSMASNPSTSAGTSLTYSVNGVPYISDVLPAAGIGNYGRKTSNFDVASPSSALILTMAVTRNSPDVLTYLDRIQLNARRSLIMNGDQFNFSDFNSVGASNVSLFSVSDLPVNGFVWDVTDRHEPKNALGTFVGSNFEFAAATDSLRSWVGSNGVDFYSPERIGTVEFQNLHGLGQAEFLIVTNKLFIQQAERLANLHRADGMSVHVVTTEQVYNEFSSGAADATAIRMFAKMFYDRGAIDPATRPKSLLLFGDGTFDPRNIVSNSNFVITYQFLNSEDHIGALVTDDYFGLLDDSESIASTDDLDIGVGRLLISTNEMANQQVDKIEHYMKNGSNFYSSGNSECNESSDATTLGDWRTKYVQVADDEEGGYFIDNDVEPQYDTVTLHYPSMNCTKLYLDAFQQVTTAGGERYPDVNAGIDKKLDEGCLVLNYVGHGGEVGVAEERVITVPQIQAWSNIDKLALIVTATCEFTKYDDPDRVSAGEWASINPEGGAIALMTTTRSVFFGVNTNTGKSFFSNVFKREANHEPRTFGEIIRQTKNGVGGGSNKRSFTLIGDPALKIALPRMNVITDSINGLSPTVVMDTLSALSKVTIKGHIEDFDASILTGFNGVVYPTIYDKPKTQQTLGNNSTSPIRTFENQTNKLYRGKATVRDGYFEFTFIVPKDINYSIGFGKLSYYAEDGVMDALGNEKSVYIGGINPNGINDTQGPAIDMSLNDDNFVNGGMTDENPLLIAKLFDENGINTVGNGIGHDLIAVLDGETSNPFVLNDYYVSDLDSYQSGEIKFDFSDLEPGSHTLSLKVWDVNNNSSEAEIDFVVHESEDMRLDHVLNYPNPFTTSTDFYFEHNQVCSQLQAQIQILTITGRLVKTINQIVSTEGFRSAGIHWDGRDDFGDQLAKGVYVYRLKVDSPDGKSDEKLEKLVILK